LIDSSTRGLKNGLGNQSPSANASGLIKHIHLKKVLFLVLTIGALPINQVLSHDAPTVKSGFSLIFMILLPLPKIILNPN